MTLLEPTLIVRESSRREATRDNPVLRDLRASGAAQASIAAVD
jgi:hypothetical protein